MSRKRILIVANNDKPGVAEQVQSLRAWFEQRAELAGVVDSASDDDLTGVRADLCIVFGGDGTFLAAARRVAPAGIPMMGVNMGKLGFLADFNVEHMRKHLDDILAGRVAPVERMMLEVRAGDGAESFRSLAANDMSIAAGEPFRIIELTVTQSDKEIATYLGDGVIVATPTGSTGYNLSAGGPILDPGVAAMVITPLAAHSLSMRPIVVRADAAIGIRTSRLNPGTRLVIDGQISRPLSEGQSIEIRRASVPARVVPHPGQSFFRTLTGKLKWAQSPHHPGGRGQ